MMAMIGFMVGREVRLKSNKIFKRRVIMRRARCLIMRINCMGNSSMNRIMEGRMDNMMRKVVKVNGYLTRFNLVTIWRRLRRL